MTAKTDTKTQQRGQTKPVQDAREGELDLAISALVGFLGVEKVMGDELVQQEGESEVDYAVRILGPIGKTAGDAFAELATVKGQLKAQKGQTTRARREIEVLREIDNPRPLGPVELGDASARNIQSAILLADEVVLAFSDGETELKGIAPRQVSAEHFELVRGKLVFGSDLVLMGPSEGEVPKLAGVALLLNGEQLAWSPLMRPIFMRPGHQFNLAGSINFG